MMARRAQLLLVLRRATLLAFALACCGAATASAQNPPVVYVHGVTENACEPANLRAVLEAIAQRLPQEEMPTQRGAPCAEVGNGSNPLRFRYVQEKEGARDRDKADGGSSQSGARRNATALRRYIDRLGAKGRRKVMLVGFSMGGLIIRTYLSDHREHAEERVSGVVFIESALQGSLAGLLAKVANSSDTRRRCEALPDFPGGSPFCLSVLNELRRARELKDEDAIAFRDLSPGSDIVRENAEATAPSGPGYLTVTGDLRIRLPRNRLGEWVFARPAEEIPLGDLLIPPGDPDPAAVPALGGASFKPTEQARLIPLTRICPASGRDLARVVDDWLGKPADEGTFIDCLRDAPESHLNINARSGEVQPGSKNLPTVVADFLVEMCKKDHLGRCAPEPLVGAGGSCGLLTSLKDQNNNRPLRLELQVERGSARCSEARELVVSYWNASGPCDRQGAGTCWRENGEWECVAPTLGTYPVIVACFGPGDTEIQAIDTEAYPVAGEMRSCGYEPEQTQPAPFDVESNLSCSDAFEIANSAVGCIFDTRCAPRGFRCETSTTGVERSLTSCTWGQRRVDFKTGA